MVSTFTPNVQLEEPARGDQVGVWDTPVNNNSTLLDLLTGGSVAISLNNANVTLASGQFQCKTITFNSTLGASVQIVFPSSFKKSYEIQNLCTGSSQFSVILTTTASSGTFIACPPGQIAEVLNDGINLKFKNLPAVGTYHHFAGTALPVWVQNCGTNGVGNTPIPYLLCDGSAFSSAAYPALAAMIGTTLPDARGRTLYSLDAGVGRVSSAGSGVIGNTLLAGGGDQLMPTHSHGVTDPNHVHTVAGGQALRLNGGSGTGTVTGGTGSALGAWTQTDSATTGISINNAGSGGAQNMPPLLVAGITMIRAG